MAHFQEVAENMMVVAHYYPTEKEEVCLVAKGHIPQAVTALMEVFGIDQMDRSHMFGWKEENYWA